MKIWSRPSIKLARVVAPGGHLVLTTDNRRAFYRLLDPLLNPALDPVKKLLRRAENKARPGVYSVRRLNAALEKAGMRIVAGAKSVVRGGGHVYTVLAGKGLS